MMYYNGTDWVRLASSTSGRILRTNGAAAPSWSDPTGIMTVENGLTETAPATVRLGGTLTQATTITQGSYTMDFNLNGTGDLRVMDGATERVRFEDGGRVEILGTTDASGTAGTGVLEIGNSLRLDGNEMITNTNAILYINNDNNGDVRMDGSTLVVDASANRVGIGTTGPSTTLDVNGTVRIRGGSPNPGDMLMATSTDGTATWTQAGYGLVPIGSIIAWHGNMSGVPSLPTGWVQCSGGTVSDAASPMNGQAIPNLNGGTTSQSGDASRGRFLRGHTTSGLFEDDNSNNLEWINHDDSGNGDTNDFLPDNGGTVTIRNYSTNGDRYQAELDGDETRVTNMSVRWILRIK
jgi:hypothetical protein